VTRESLGAADPPGRRKQLESYLREQIAAGLGIPVQRVELGAPVNGLGLDSLMIYEVKRRVRADLDVALPAVRFFEKVTIPDLAREIADQLEQPADQQQNPSLARQRATGHATDPNGRRRERSTLLQRYWRGVARPHT